MWTRARKMRIAFGLSLLVLGVAGLGLPVIQGGLLIVLGTLILSKEIPLFKKIADRMKGTASARESAA